MNIPQTAEVKKKMGMRSKDKSLDDLPEYERAEYLATRGTDKAIDSTKCPTCGKSNSINALYCSVSCYVIRTDVIVGKILNGSRAQEINRQSSQNRSGVKETRPGGLYIKGHNLGKPKSYRWGKEVGR